MKEEVEKARAELAKYEEIPSASNSTCPKA